HQPARDADAAKGAVTLPVSKDNVIFGLRACNQAGQCSAAVVPLRRGDNGSMPGSRPLTLSFPPFAGMTKNLILVNLAVFAASLLSHLVHPLAVIPALLMLTPNAVVHALFVWQPLTFGFVPDLSLLSVLFSMLSLWFMGFYLEDLRGSRFLLETYLISTLLGGVLATALSFTGFLHMSPGSTITGANAALFGLLACFAVLYGDQQFYMLPLPFGIKAKYLAIILKVIAFVMLIGGGNTYAEVA